MTYQPYPSGGGVGSKAPVDQDPPQPMSLHNAVRLMYLGAVVALLGTIFTLAISSKIKTDVFNAVRKNQGKGGYTIAQPHTVANVTFVALGRWRFCQRPGVVLDGLGQQPRQRLGANRSIRAPRPHYYRSPPVA